MRACASNFPLWLPSSLSGACGVLLFLCGSPCVRVHMCVSHGPRRCGQSWFIPSPSLLGTPHLLGHPFLCPQNALWALGKCLSALSLLLSLPDAPPLMPRLLPAQAYLLCPARAPHLLLHPKTTQPHSVSNHSLEPVLTGPLRRCLRLIWLSPRPQPALSSSH